MLWMIIFDNLTLLKLHNAFLAKQIRLAHNAFRLILTMDLIVFL